MTDLEKSIGDALRLSEKALKNEKMLRMIQKNIKVARAELIRVGVSIELANSSHPLIEECIVTYCLYKMDDEKMQEKHFESFQYQEDLLRKSSIALEE